MQQSQKEIRTLANIAERLEERDQRSKWDWAVLGAAMLIAAGLAGTGAVYFTKQELDNANFVDAIQLIQSDKDGYWCQTTAQATTVQDSNGTWFCAVSMPEFQTPVDREDNE